MPEGPQGPVMLVATNMLRPPPTRIGKIGENFTLPRTIPLLSAISGGAGLFLGLVLAVPFMGLGGLRALMIGGILGAAAGVAVVTLSPIRGESLARWLGLKAAGMRAPRVEVDGRPAKVYVGIAPLSSTALGRVSVRGGAVDVVAGSVDERGVLIPHSVVVEERRQRAADLLARRGPSLGAPEEVRHLPGQHPDGRGARRGAEQPHRATPPAPGPAPLREEGAVVVPAARRSPAQSGTARLGQPQSDPARPGPAAAKRTATKKLAQSKNKPLTPTKR